jgi:hypothetical protein
LNGIQLHPNYPVSLFLIAAVLIPEAVQIARRPLKFALTFTSGVSALDHLAFWAAAIAGANPFFALASLLDLFLRYLAFWSRPYAEEHRDQIEQAARHLLESLEQILATHGCRTASSVKVTP